MESELKKSLREWLEKAATPFGWTIDELVEHYEIEAPASGGSLRELVKEIQEEEGG